MKLRIDFLGTPIDSLDMQDAIEWVDDKVPARKPHHVLVTNANKFWLMRRNAQLKEVACRADLILPERGIALCSAILGKPLKDDVAGVAFAKELLGHCEKRGYSIYFLGATAEVQRCLLETVRRNHPGLRVAGSHDGFFLPGQNDAVLMDIRSRKPDVLLVAMGSPAQEYWIREQIDKDEIVVPVSVGVGGAFEVIAGLKRDAPKWVRKSGIEWLFRFFQSPRRYGKRYLCVVPYLIFAVLVEGIFGFDGRSKRAKEPKPHSGMAPSPVASTEPERAEP